jgi:hypothetical protein
MRRILRKDEVASIRGTATGRSMEEDRREDRNNVPGLLEISLVGNVYSLV